MRSPVVGVAVTALLIVATAGTSLAQGEPSPGSEGWDRIVLPVLPGSTVEGLVEVDGHDIYARCAGEAGAVEPELVQPCFRMCARSMPGPRPPGSVSADRVRPALPAAGPFKPLSADGCSRAS